MSDKKIFLRQNIFFLLAAGAMVFVCRKIWLMDFPITNFEDLTLSMATAKNIDISKAIRWYSFYAIPLCFLFAWLSWKNGLVERAAKFFGGIKIHGAEENLFIVVLLVIYLVMGHPQNILSIFLVAAILLLWIFSREKEKILTAWLCSLWIFQIPCLYLSQYLGGEKFIGFLIFGSIIYFCSRLREEESLGKFYVRMYPFLAASLVNIFILAALEIFLVRGHVANDILLLMPYAMAGLYMIFFKPKENVNYERKILRGSLAIMVFSCLPVLGQSGLADFFEGANHGLSIQEFILGRGLPIIDNLDSHMTSEIFGGILWFILTGDYVGAMLAPYREVIFSCLEIPAFFFLLKQFLSERQAFIILVLFPWGMLTFSWAGFIALGAFLFWKNKPSLARSFSVWIIFIFLCLYRIDLGASSGLALILCPIFYCLAGREKKVLAKFFVAGIFLSGVGLFTASNLAAETHGSLGNFLQDFLTAFLSNQHWAYGDLGKFSRVVCVYFILPAVMAILFLPSVKRIFSRQTERTDWIFLFLYVTFFFGISRMMVRHTFVELPFSVSTYSVEFLLFSLLIVSLFKKYRAMIFMVAMCFCMIVGGRAGNDSLVSRVMWTAGTINSVHAEQKEFFRLNEIDLKQIILSKKFFDEMLPPGETYFDFTNQSLFFAATERVNPVYMNQCPAMINGVKGQRQAINSLEKKNPGFVVMSLQDREQSPYSCYTQIDGILNADRYYLLAEYVAKNYQPYCRVGNFAVWSLKSRYEENLQKDKSLGAEREYLGYLYDAPENHVRQLGEIPFLWGKSFVSSREEELSRARENVWDLRGEKILGRVGFLSLEISAAEDTWLTLRIKGNGIHDMVYQFKVHAGKNFYRIRPSSDFFWYSDAPEILEIDAGNFSVEKIIFQEGEQ